MPASLVGTTLVSTGRDNGPARELYRRRGFTVVREREAIPGLWVTELDATAEVSA